MPVQQLDYDKAKLLIQVETENEAKWRVNACRKEPWTVAFIESIPSEATFWDIGANVGSYTLIALSRGLRTIAVEPGYENYSRLCHNLALNNLLDRGRVIPAAVWGATGWTWFEYRDLRPGGAHHIMGAAQRTQFHRQQVPCFRFDDLVIYAGAENATPFYLKIDVDGNEGAVLAGIDRSWPAIAGIILEMPLGMESDLAAQVVAHGFRLVERYDEREGKQIEDICYARFER